MLHRALINRGRGLGQLARGPRELVPLASSAIGAGSTIGAAACAQTVPDGEAPYVMTALTNVSRFALHINQGI